MTNVDTTQLNTTDTPNENKGKGFYQLNQGDIVWTVFGERGSKDTKTKLGNRPCMIVSNYKMHRHFHMAMVVPITTKNHRPKANVEIKSVDGITGYAEPYQLKTIDLKSRGYKYAGHASNEEIGELLGKLNALITPVK